jgi:S-disulfanyl-L-cysteine oxidoreductase SoxD
MKYIFPLALLLVLGAAGLMGYALVVRWNDNMTDTPRIVAGERVFAMPAGVVPRGGELSLPREARDQVTAQPNPIKPTPESLEMGRRHWVTFCVPCHGEIGKGDGTVSTKFVPPLDLTNVGLQRARTDGYYYHYIGAGGAVMPAYGEVLSPEERWHVVNFVRTLAGK